MTFGAMMLAGGASAEWPYCMGQLSFDVFLLWHMVLGSMQLHVWHQLAQLWQTVDNNCTTLFAAHAIEGAVTACALQKEALLEAFKGR